MTIFRILLILAGIWILWRVLRGLGIGIGQAKSATPPAENFEPMAKCAKCGVHQPAATLSSDGRCGKCATVDSARNN